MFESKPKDRKGGVDVALIKPNKNSAKISDMWEVFGDAYTPEAGTEVYKYGCATGLTHGRVHSAGPKKILVKIMVTGPFSIVSDSGSLVIALDQGRPRIIGVVSHGEINRLAIVDDSDKPRVAAALNFEIHVLRTKGYQQFVEISLLVPFLNEFQTEIFRAINGHDASASNCLFTESLDRV